MQKLKRFTTRPEILLDIERLKSWRQTKLKLAADLNRKADDLFTWLNDNPSRTTNKRFAKSWNAKKWKADDLRQKARLAQHSSERTHDAKMAQLVRTLSAFDTQPMPFSDDAVVLQNKPKKGF